MPPLGSFLGSRIAGLPANIAAAVDAASAPTTTGRSPTESGADAGPFGGINAVSDALRGVGGAATDTVGGVGADIGGRFGMPDLTGRGLTDVRLPGLTGWRPPIDLPAGPIEGRRPSTQLAQNAIGVLRGASREALSEATQRVRAKQVPPERMIDWLERKTRIGEVLAAPASGWSQDTVADFAGSFQMAPNNLPVMDAIVAMAILNWPDLEGEIRQENTPAVTGGDLLQNRRVIYQSPAAGTPLEPPYVILVAVEHQDLRRADEVVASIMGTLVTAGGFKMPREAAAKIS